MTAPAGILPDASSPARAAILDRVAVGLLFVLVALAVLGGVLVTDSGRDLANAVAIAQGWHRPLAGPSFNVIWSLGPAWFYLLAAPMLAWPSLLGALLLMAALVALKVPLAWCLGRRIAGNTAGLALAALVALPGWSALAALTPTHASVVEAGVLGSLLLALRARQSGPQATLFPLGLVACLALHAHPTALAAFPLLLALVWANLRARPWALAGLLLGALLPALPMLWLELSRGLPQLDGTVGYFGRGDYLARVAAMPANALGYFTGGEAFADRLLQQRADAWPWLQGLGLLLGGAGLLGALRLAGRGEHRALLAWAYLLAALAFVLLLRHPMPPWMMHSLQPLKALALLGVLGLVTGSLARRRLAQGLVLLAMAAAAWHVAALAGARAEGELRVPVELAVDVTGRFKRSDELRSYLPAIDHPRLARRLCLEGDDLRLHGDAAALLLMAEATATAIHCGDAEVRIGGAGPARHRAALPRAMARSLGLESAPRFAGFALIEPTAVLHPSEGARLALDPEYLPHRLWRLQARGTESVRLEPDCPPGEWLVATDLGFGGNGLTLEVRRDGAPVPPDVRGWLTRAWRCDGKPVEIVAEALRPELLDIVRLR